MSMGPRPKESSVEIGNLNKVQHTVKKMTESYFVNPIHYLFYGFLFAMMAGLFFGMNFPLSLYLFLIGLGASKFTIFLFPELFINKIKTKENDNN